MTWPRALWIATGVAAFVLAWSVPALLSTGSSPPPLYVFEDDWGWVPRTAPTAVSDALAFAWRTSVLTCACVSVLRIARISPWLELIPLGVGASVFLWGSLDRQAAGACSDLLFHQAPPQVQEETCPAVAYGEYP